jgi:hypothetical protein
MQRIPFIFYELLGVAVSAGIVSHCYLLQIGFVFLKELFLLHAGSVNPAPINYSTTFSRSIVFFKRSFKGTMDAMYGAGRYNEIVWLESF